MPPLLLPFLLAAGAAAPPPPPPLTAIIAVRRLSPAEAAKARPVRLEGVITHWNDVINDGFLQDGTGGIYLTPYGGEKWRPGDRVVVTGRSDPGDFAPCIVDYSARSLGRGPLPDAEPFSLTPDEAIPLDGQFVHVHAFAYRVAEYDGQTGLKVATASGLGLVLVPGDHKAAFAKLVGRAVQLRAVCVPPFADRRATGGPVRLHVSSPDAVREVAGEIPAAPAALADVTRGFRPGSLAAPHPVFVAGTVTGRVGPREAFVQDDTGGALVHAVETLDPALAVGDRVEARGFLSAEGPLLLVRNATLQRVGPGRLPPAAPARLPLLGREVMGRLATLDAELERAGWRDNGFVLDLRDGPNRFRAVLLGADAGTMDRLESGSRLRLVGVPFVVFPSEREAGLPPSLILGSPSDVALLEGPSWWTAERVRYLAGGSAAVVAVVGLWAWALRRQVARQRALLQAQFDREARLAESLRQARKLEAIGRLAAGISHDFNNLLTVILGNGEMLADRLRDAPEARQLADFVVQAGERAALLTRQLLTFSRQQPADLKPIDLGAFLSANEAFFRRVVGSHIRLRVESEPGLSAVMADETQLQQILMNLTANARDAMPAGGDLVMSASAAGAAVRLSVRDTGVGMDEATRAKAFEPFFTTKEVGKGTGLGLATVYGTAAGLGAALEVESAPGVGTAIHIDFPAAGVAAEPRPAAPPPARAGGGVVLLLDDDDGVRDVCEAALRMYGFDVRAASRAAAAVESAAGPGPVDLFVTDLIMPGMNGKEAAVAVRAARPGVPVLFMSGYPPEEVRRIVGDLPAYGLITKPFTPLALVAAVQEALEEKGRPRPALRGGEGPG